MRPNLKLHIAAAVWLAAGLGCGEDADLNPNPDRDENNRPSNNPISITVAGSLSIHPVSLSITPGVGFGAAGDVTYRLVNPVDLLSAGGDLDAITPLAAGSLDPTMDCTGLDCTFSISEVDISGLTLGLVAIILDGRTSRELIPTVGGVFGPATAAALKTSGSNYTEAVLFAVSEGTLGALAGFTGGAYDAATMLANGALLGTVLNENEEPVENVTVTTDSAVYFRDAGSELNVFYPTADFLGVGTSTANNGFFFSVANAPIATAALWQAVGTENWESITSGTNPGTVFVLLWAAD